MENIVIIGSGFSAFNTFLKFKKYKPIIITATHKHYSNLQISNRKILNTNKIFSNKTRSSGDLLYILKKKTKLHDRVSFGGNSNIWGGFININSLNREAIDQYKKIGISFNKLIQNHNGYLSNNSNIRQLRDLNNKILDTSNFLKSFIPGFVETIEFRNKLIKINYLADNDKKESIIASKLFLGISFPQLIDLLYRSKLLSRDCELTLSEFEQKKIINNHNSIKIKSENSLIIKYDLIRAIKHFIGLQKSLDKFAFKLPIYIDQIFSNNKIFLKLNFNFKDKIITQNTSQKFGQSIHYCNLCIDEKNINEYLSIFSSNLFGVSTPFVDQKKPGPISNDIIQNIWDRF